MKALFALAALLLVPAYAHAQGWIEPLHDAPAHIVRLRTTVSVHVTGHIAEVQVEDWFANRGGRVAEADYLYPMPGEAVFGSVSLFQGDQELRGETMDARQARATYEAIVRKRRDPALIELAGHGLLRARIFPIDAGAQRRITLRYTQVLARAGDALVFRYAASTAASRGARAPLTFLLRADSAGRFGTPYSPTDAIRTVSRNGAMEIRPTSHLTGDVTIFLPLVRPVVGVTFASHRPDASEDGYFMLTLSPGDVRADAVPRDITAVVDVSGSMSGSKIVQARAALRQLLASLAPTDRFRLIAFSSRVTAYREGWTPATRSAVTKAISWVDALTADGGTDIAGALAEAFRASSPASRLPIAVFLTDGLPSVGERNPERIAAEAERARGRTRVFAFGVGNDVNTYLLDRLTAAGRGATEYVGPGEDVEQSLGRLAAKIQHPVLTDIELSAPVRLTEIYPRTLPDLFRGDELIIFGRYAAGAKNVHGQIRVTGRRNTRTERFRTDVTFPAHELGNGFIPRLWAARKLGALQRQVRLEGATPDLISEIKATALRYGLLSEYTSYLVREPSDVAVVPRRAVPATAPGMVAAETQVGAGWIARAKAQDAQRRTSSLSDLARVDSTMLLRGHMTQAVQVAGRLFVDRDGVWTDFLHGDSLRVVSVEPYSDAYFALLRALPELRPYVARFDRVLVAGHHVSIRFAPGGATDASLVNRLVRAFRGP